VKPEVHNVSQRRRRRTEPWPSSNMHKNLLQFGRAVVDCGVMRVYRETDIMEFGEAIKNPAYRIPQTEYSGCLDISAHA